MNPFFIVLLVITGYVLIAMFMYFIFNLLYPPETRQYGKKNYTKQEIVFFGTFFWPFGVPFFLLIKLVLVLIKLPESAADSFRNFIKRGQV